jgi:hypothetical protein
MPITKTEVLEVLDDGRLRNIRFSVGPININAGEYDKVYDLIEAGAVTVKPWKESYSLYFASSNLIRTAAKEPPLTPIIRSNVLHECTHVITDMNKIRVTRVADEAAAYLAQVTYHLMLEPNYDPPTIRGIPEYDMIRLCVRLAKQYELGKSGGNGAQISADDIRSIANMVPSLPEYSHIKPEEIAVADGVGMDSDEAEEFYRRQVSRMNTQLLNELMAEDTRRLIESSMKVQIVAYENYVTWDPELLELFALATSGTSDKNKAALLKLHRIFATIAQRSAVEYNQRLSALRKGDKVSEKFHAVFQSGQRAALLDALRVPR